MVILDENTHPKSKLYMFIMGFTTPVPPNAGSEIQLFVWMLNYLLGSKFSDLRS